MSATIHNCPCCGAVLPKVVPLNAVPDLAHLNAQQTAVFCLLAMTPGQWVRSSKVHVAVWGDDIDGGPLRAAEALAVIISQMRPKLASFGVNVVNGWPEQKGRHRLVFVADEGGAAS